MCKRVTRGHHVGMRLAVGLGMPSVVSAPSMNASLQQKGCRKRSDRPTSAASDVPRTPRAESGRSRLVSLARANLVLCAALFGAGCDLSAAELGGLLDGLDDLECACKRSCAFGVAPSSISLSDEGIIIAAEATGEVSEVRVRVASDVLDPATGEVLRDVTERRSFVAPGLAFNAREWLGLAPQAGDELTFVFIGKGHGCPVKRIC